MLLDYKLGQSSIVLRVKLRNSSVATGAGLTGLSSASAGLIISTIADNEATATAYTVTGATIESITTLGTYAAPTATKCRFKEVDSTNHKGIYEIQIADARFAVAGAKSLLVSISGATNLAECDVVIPLRSVNPYDGVRGGMTALPNAAAEAAGGLFTRGTGAGQINQDANGRIDVNAKAWIGGTIPAVNVTGVPKVDVVDWLGSAPNALQSGRVDGYLGAGAANVITAAMIADGAIDRATFAADTGLQTARSNTAQAGGAGTITLDASASATDDAYTDCWITLTGGTGAGQTRLISAYVGSTKVATVARNWTTNPDATTTFAILNVARVDLALWLGVAPNALTSGRVESIVGAYASGQAPLQPTVAGRTVDVAATGEVGLDFDNIHDATGAHTLTNIRMPNVTLTDTVTTYTGNTPQTGDAYARLGAPAGANVSADVAAVKTDTGNLVSRLGAWTGSGVNTVLGAFKALLSKTATLPTDIGGTFDPTTDSTEALRDNVGTNGAALVLAKTTNITGFNDLSAAQVKTQAVDALATDTYAEPSAVPAATASLKDKIGWLTCLARNKRTQTSTTETLRNDGDTGSVGTSAKADDGTTFTRSKWV